MKDLDVKPGMHVRITESEGTGYVGRVMDCTEPTQFGRVHATVHVPRGDKTVTLVKRASDIEQIDGPQF